MTTRNCACCGFEMWDVSDMYGICRICGWHDDYLQNRQPDFPGGANSLSLNVYKAHWPELTRKRRAKKKRIDKLEREARENPEKAANLHMESTMMTISDLANPIKGPCGELPEKEMSALVQDCADLLPEDEVEFLHQFIARKQGELGMEYLLWVIYDNGVLVPKELYGKLERMAKQLCLADFYMEGLRQESQR